jgi:hypothetical protein
MHQHAEATPENSRWVSLWTIETAEYIRLVEALELSPPCPWLHSMMVLVVVVTAMVPWQWV